MSQDSGGQLPPGDPFRRLTRDPLVLGVAAALFLAAPLVFPELRLMLILSPLPILVATVARGAAVGLGVLSFALAVAWFSGGNPNLEHMGGFFLGTGLFVGGFPLLAGWLLRLGFPLRTCQAALLLVTLLAVLGGILLFWSLGTDVEQELVQIMGTVRDGWLDSYRQSPDMDVKTLAELEATTAFLVELVPRIFPGILGVGWAIIQMIALWLGRAVLLGGGELPESQKLSTLRLPDWFIWPAIAALFLTMTSQGGVGMLAINTAMVLALVYFFVGLGIAHAAFAVYRVSGFWRGLFYGALVLMEPIKVALLMIGLLDHWFDFRKELYRRGKHRDDPPA